MLTLPNVPTVPTVPTVLLRRAAIAACTAVALALASVVAPGANVPGTGVPGLGLPEAQAAQISIVGDQANITERMLRGTVDRQSQVANLAFNDSSTGGPLRTALEARVYINGRLHKGEPKMSAHGDTVTLRTTDVATGVEVIRTFTFGPAKATLQVDMVNPTKGDLQMQVDLMHNAVLAVPRFDIVEGATPIVARTADPEYDVTVDFAGNPQATGFSNGSPGWSDAPYGEEGTKAKKGPLGPGNNARLQAGRWFAPLTPNEPFSGAMTVTVAPPPEKHDADGDGIPDEWERTGFTPDGYRERLDLANWGADPTKPDIFLQLNWMKPQVDSCSNEGTFDRSPRGFRRFRECVKADSNTYRPSRESLDELVKLFKAQGFNLHIDAGTWYNNFTSDPKQLRGGPTVPYKKFYFDTHRVAEDKLLEDRDKYLGARKAVFRLGVIGDAIAPDDSSSGIGNTPGGSFYVAKPASMTSDMQVRNTILHELGHNLGLSHGGTIKVPENKNHNYLPNYRSTMNYLYQLSHFGYSTEEATDTPTLPPECRGKPCYRGSYKVPADWPNLMLNDGTIGRASGTLTPADPNGREDRHPPIRELEINAAPRNNGKAGFRLISGGSSSRNAPSTPGIVMIRNDNEITGEISNLGRRDHTFTVEATFGSGSGATKHTQTVTVPGLPAGTSTSDTTAGKARVTIPVTLPARFRGAELPTTIRVVNADGVQQYSEAHSLPVLDYTEAEAEKVLKEILADPATPKEDREAARRLLDPQAKRDGTGTARPAATGTPPPPDSGSSNPRTAQIIAGSVVGLLALLLGVAGFFFIQNRP